jgi:formate-dependent nitrite reductase membrane component NrfD
MLKAPVWKWEIAWYFFLGGLSAGAYVISRMAFRHGKEECPDVCRTGARVALLAFLPCPPLLIHDLGDPKRFHHMMRVWKPTTPMNLGTWSILGYSGMVTFEVLRKYLEEHEREHGPGLRRHLFRLMDHPLPLLVHDALGVPFALLVAGYTGVLLSCTSNPLWSKNLWLGPLFSASAIGTGAAATSLAIDLTGGAEDSHSQRVLEKIDTAAHIAEVACMAGFLKQAGEKAQPLTKGKHRKHMMVAAGCLAGAEVIRHLPLQGRAKKLARMTSSLLTLGSGFALRWAMVQAGHDAANDPRLARIASRPQTQSAQRRQVQSTNKARPNG